MRFAALIVVLRRSVNLDRGDKSVEVRSLNTRDGGPHGNISTRIAAQLLDEAISEPGLISSAYTAFHNYSLGNQILALAQCLQRGIPPGPIATFQRWKEVGRFVRKGEKALTLCRPVRGSVQYSRTHRSSGTIRAGPVGFRSR